MEQFTLGFWESRCWASACRFGKQTVWYNTPMSLNGEIGAGEKDLGLKTSDLGMTSDIGLLTIAEVGRQVSGVGVWQQVV